jgi:hypothetical protein
VNQWHGGPPLSHVPGHFGRVAGRHPGVVRAVVDDRLLSINSGDRKSSRATSRADGRLEELTTAQAGDSLLDLRLRLDGDGPRPVQPSGGAGNGPRRRWRAGLGQLGVGELEHGGRAGVGYPEVTRGIQGDVARRGQDL